MSNSVISYLVMLLNYPIKMCVDVLQQLTTIFKLLKQKMMVYSRIAGEYNLSNSKSCQFSQHTNSKLFTQAFYSILNQLNYVCQYFTVVLFAWFLCHYIILSFYFLLISCFYFNNVLMSIIMKTINSFQFNPKENILV